MMRKDPITSFEGLADHEMCDFNRRTHGILLAHPKSAKQKPYNGQMKQEQNCNEENE